MGFGFFFGKHHTEVLNNLLKKKILPSYVRMFADCFSDCFPSV